MSVEVDARYGVARAPGGLGFVQDLVNSDGMLDFDDELATVASARAWVKTALRTWAEERGSEPSRVSLDRGELERLRDLRASVLALLRDGGLPATAGQISGALHVAVRPDGSAVWTPVGSGVGYLTSLVLLELSEAQLRDTRRRLKACGNPACAVAFYDRSRNNSGVWHDVHSCGNTMNLRAHRARRVTHAD